MKPITQLLICILLAASICSLNAPLFTHDEILTEQTAAKEYKSILSRVTKETRANGFIRFDFNGEKIWAVNIESALKKYRRLRKEHRCYLATFKNNPSIYLVREILC